MILRASWTLDIGRAATWAIQYKVIVEVDSGGSEIEAFSI